VGWTVEQKNGSAMGGETTEYIFASRLGPATSGANNATLQYFFNAFDSNQLITTGMFSGAQRWESFSERAHHRRFMHRE
jgi:hypothetical protein